MRRFTKVPVGVLFGLITLSGTSVLSQGQEGVVVDYLAQPQNQATIWIEQQGQAPQARWRGPTIGGIGVPKSFTNPILPGFHAWPSLCRVDRTYYLVSSSGNWSPGISLFRSRDLINWEPLNSVLQHTGIDLTGDELGPATIRHHDGLYYISSTMRCRCCRRVSPFYMSARDPAGPWSEPILLDAPGLEMSLFFDDSERVWTVGTPVSQTGCSVSDAGLIVQELDLEHKRLKGPRARLMGSQYLHDPGLSQARLYKRNGHYLLLTTTHCQNPKRSFVNAFQACTLHGPYTSCIANPILSTGDNTDGQIHAVGLGDIVETHHHEWWGVCHGVRKGAATGLLGLETFLLPLNFKDGWPHFPMPLDRALASQPRPDLGWHVAVNPRERDDFAFGRLKPIWQFLGTPTDTWWQCQARTGWLRLQLLPERPTEAEKSALVARRIQDSHFYAGTKLDFRSRSAHERSGLIALVNHRNQYRLSVGSRAGQQYVTLWQVDRGVETRVAEVPLKMRPIHLAVQSEGPSLSFWAGAENNLQPIGEPVDARLLTTPEQNGGYVGVFATSQGQASDSFADFDWFDYQQLAPLAE